MSMKTKVKIKVEFIPSLCLNHKKITKVEKSAGLKPLTLTHVRTHSSHQKKQGLCKFLKTLQMDFFCFFAELSN